MKKVAILDAQTIQTLPVAKSLKNLGFYVILICESTNSYGYRTKYADKKIIAPSTKHDAVNFHLFFTNFLSNEKIDIVIPMNDYSAEYLSINKEQLLNYTNFTIPAHDIFCLAYDKNLLMKECKESNFPHPKTYDLTFGTLDQATDYVGFPALIKPNKTTGARGFAIVNSIVDLQTKLPAIINSYGDCHLQEFIPSGGKQFKVELFINNLNLINATVIHKIRFYPEKGGSSCFNQTVERNDLISLCFDVLKTIKWEGFADFDLIEDPRDGIVKIMEINPRIPACIKASLNAGVDFVENIANSSLGLPIKKYSFNPGNYLRYFGLDLLWFIKSKNRFRTKPSWFSSIFSSKQSLQDGSFDDLNPFIHGTIGGLLKQLDPRFRAAKKEMN
jgi:predicted ATP-grasp superfamily ATP-dependent carboligase